MLSLCYLSYQMGLFNRSEPSSKAKKKEKFEDYTAPPKHVGNRNENTVITWEKLSENNGKTTDKYWLDIDGYCYKLTPWLKYHPGGEIVLRDHAGRDATDAFLAFHRPEPLEVSFSSRFSISLFVSCIL